MLIEWMEFISGVLIAMFGLYMLGYGTRVMPSGLTAMIKWKIPLLVVRLIGLILLIGGILTALPRM
jgi:hypothetical protein